MSPNMLPSRRRTNRVAKRRRGQAMVEMALVMFILLSLTFGIADFGLYMYDFVQAANCVRESARRAAVRADDAESPPFCISSNLQPTVTAGYKTLPVGSEVTATLDKTHRLIAVCYFVPGMSCDQPLKAATSMRMEGEKI